MPWFTVKSWWGDQTQQGDGDSGEYSYRKGNVSPEAGAKANLFREHPLFLGTEDEEDFRLNPYWRERAEPYLIGRNIDLDELRVGFEDLGAGVGGRTSNFTGRIAMGSMDGLYGVNSAGNIEGNWSMLQDFLHESMHEVAFNDSWGAGLVARSAYENTFYSDATRYDTSGLQNLSYYQIDMSNHAYLQDQLAQRFAEDVTFRLQR
jgi:hypothetical protein